MQNPVRLSYLSSVTALGVATCCVVPMALMLLGLGGSWIAIFGKIAATSFVVLALSSAVVTASWVASYRRGSLARLKWWLSGSTILTALAWVIVFNETRINDYLIMWM